MFPFCFSSTQRWMQAWWTHFVVPRHLKIKIVKHGSIFRSYFSDKIFRCAPASKNKNRQTWFNFQNVFFRQNTNNKRDPPSMYSKLGGRKVNENTNVNVACLQCGTAYVTLRTFNINICVSFLFFVYPTLNAGLVDPFCCTTASKIQNCYLSI